MCHFELDMLTHKNMYLLENNGIYTIQKVVPGRRGAGDEDE